MGQQQSQAIVAGFQAGSKWLTIEKSKDALTLSVGIGTSAALESHGSDKLSLITVFGRARTGKSFLMNKISGKAGLFVVRPGHETTTIGADLSSVISANDFLGDAASGSAAGKLAFVDVEGQGVEGDGYDVVLMAPLLLVSRVVIFNWTGKLAKNDMLTKLAVVVQAARMVALEGPAGAGVRKFGDLHIVMRDQSDIQGVHEDLFELEPEVDAAAKGRNEVRKTLLESFTSCSVSSLPAPVESTALLDAGTFTETDVTGAFDAGVTELKGAIIKQLATQRPLCGRVLSAGNVAEIMPLLADATNNGQKEFLPQSVFEQMEKRQAQAATKAAIAVVDTWRATQQEKMPLSPAALYKAIEAEQQQCISQLSTRLADVAAAVRAEAVARLKAHFNNVKEVLVLANDKAVAVAIYNAKAEALQELKPLQALFEQRDKPEEEERLTAAVKKAAGPIIQRFTKAIGGLADTTEGKQGLKAVQDKVDAIAKGALRRNQSLREAQERAEREKRELEQRERQERERLEREKRERQERARREKQQREQQERARAQREREMREQWEGDQRERERLERERREQQERRERQERQERERRESERREREMRKQWEREQQERERRERQERCQLQQEEAARRERAYMRQLERELEREATRERERERREQEQNMRLLAARRQAQAQRIAQPPPGYTQDRNGRWHKPNGQFASNAEIYGDN